MRNIALFYFLDHQIHPIFNQNLVFSQPDVSQQQIILRLAHRWQAALGKQVSIGLGLMGKRMIMNLKGMEIMLFLDID